MNDDNYIYNGNYDEDYSIIKKSGLFDEEWYVNSNSDIIDDPIAHFLKIGYKNNYNPSPDFDVLWYLEEYPDVKNAGINPFVHYIEYGQREGRLPLPFDFDLKYEGDYRCILASGMFDKDWFLSNYSLDGDVDPIIYYLENGVSLGLNPSPDFDTWDYLKANPDVENSNFNPFIHFIQFGQKEGRLSKLFSFDELSALNVDKSIMGRDNYLFLINDSNEELRQHFDEDYRSKFSYADFVRDFFFKKYIFEKKGIDYYYLFIPDKSVICKELMPIKYDVFRRNVVQLDFIPDFSRYLNKYCYWKFGSNLNYLGGEKLSFNILKYIDQSFESDDFKNLITNCILKECEENSDLLDLNHFSNVDFKEKLFKISSLKYPVPKMLTNLEVPSEIVSSDLNKSEYYYNPNAFSDIKVLIFCDSSFETLKYYMGLYFREMFLYVDDLQLNPELIKWFNPDIIIELRAESSLENYITSNCIKEKMWW